MTLRGSSKLQIKTNVPPLNYPVALVPVLDNAHSRTEVASFDIELDGRALALKSNRQIADKMDRRISDKDRYLDFEAFKKSTNTTTPPAVLARSRSSLSPPRSQTGIFPSTNPILFDFGATSSSFTRAETPRDISPRRPSSHIFADPTKLVESQQLVSSVGNSRQPRCEGAPEVEASEKQFHFTFEHNMVREQEPPRHPLSTSRPNGIPPLTTIQLDEKKGERKVPQINPLRQLQFGQPNAPGPPDSTSSYTEPQQQKSSAKISDSQVYGKKSTDNYSHMFIPSKPSFQQPQAWRHHPSSQSAAPRPAIEQTTKNSQYSHETAEHAIEQGKKWFHDHVQNHPAQPSMSRTTIAVPQPQQYAQWQPQPASRPMFSSHAYSNPFYERENNVVDLMTNSVGMVTNRGLFNDDRFGASDPYMYVDAAKANENIKALLEGAFEDEEDKPRTRRSKQQLDKKADELASQMQSMTIKPEVLEAQDEEAEEDEDKGNVEGLKVDLLPHQVDGVKWMRDKETGTKKTRGVYPKGGILADDMGLGKTIQSIALLLTNPRPLSDSAEATKRKLAADVEKTTLVVAPLALIKQWEGEITDRVESSHKLKVLVHHGPQRSKSFKDLKKFDVVITTYQTLASEHASSEGTLKVGCFGLHWYRVILDEAHSIKNRNAKATKAAYALSAEYRWCLTGTPMQNNLDELQSLIRFLQIKPYDDLNIWREQITKPMNNGRGGLAIKRLQVYLKAFMKRRTKDVLKQQGALSTGTGTKKGTESSNQFKIVQRVVEEVEAEFTPEEHAFYDRLESRTEKSLELMMAGNKMSYASALVLLLRLRQACNHPDLIKGDLSKEKEAFLNSSGNQTPSRRKAVADTELDSIADMLGGLSVETKRCDVCQIELLAREASTGAIRCVDCEADLAAQASKEQKVKKERKEAKKAKQSRLADARRKQNRRIIDDSDDEEDEAEPAVNELLTENATSDDDAEDEDSSLYTSSDEESSATTTPVPSTKIRQLLSLLTTDSSTHKYIVFSFFTSMLDLIEPFLHQSRIRFVRYDGQMRNDAREASLTALRTDDRVRVMLCSLRAGSLGLNLTAASRVVILEPFWNPFVEEQAIDRVHRLNQTQDVKVYKLTVRNTVEERIVALQERKRDLADKALESGGAKGGVKLTLQDMLRLFRHDAEGEHRVDMHPVGGGRGTGGLLTATNNVGSGGAAAPGAGSATHRPRPAEKRKEHEVYGRRW